MFFALDRDPKVRAADISTRIGCGGGDISAAHTPRLYKHIRVTPADIAVETLYFQKSAEDFSSIARRNVALSAYHTVMRPIEYGTSPGEARSPVIAQAIAHVPNLCELWKDSLESSAAGTTWELFDPVLEAVLSPSSSINAANNPVDAVRHAQWCDDVCLLLEAGYSPAGLSDSRYVWGKYQRLNAFLINYRRNCAPGHHIDTQTKYLATLAASPPCEALGGSRPVALRIPNGVPTIYSPGDMAEYLDELYMGMPDDCVARLVSVLGPMRKAACVSETYTDRYRRCIAPVVSVPSPLGDVATKHHLPEALTKQYLDSREHKSNVPECISRAFRAAYDLAAANSSTVHQLGVDNVYIDVVKTFGAEMMFVISAQTDHSKPLFVIHIDFARMLLWPSNLHRIVRPTREVPPPMF